MNVTNGTDSNIAWLWAIEYLASFREIETSILLGLVEAAPELPEDLGKNTREKVALRCLEDLLDLFGRSYGLNFDDVSSASDQRHTFDLSESCENVLESVLQMMSELGFKMAGVELSRSNFRPFIMHRRASMPKCALEELKGAIIGGLHPCAALLKKLGGLVQTIDECDEISADNNGDNGKTWRILGNDPAAQDMATEDMSCLPVENENGIVGDDLYNQNLLPLKRGRSSMDEEALVGGHRENLPHMVDDDHHLNAKRFKQGASFVDQSVGQVPIHGNDLVEDSSERVVEIVEKEGRYMEKGSQITRSEENVPSDDVCDELVAVRLPQSHDVNGDDVFEHEHNPTISASESPRDTSGVGPGPNHCILVDEADDATLMTSNSAPFVRNQPKGSVDKAEDVSDHGNQLNSLNTVALNNCYRTSVGVEDEMTHFFKEDTTTDSNEHHHERVDVAKKKSHFLSSQWMLSHDSLDTADWTEQNLCAKCGEGGQLLVCSGSGCPLAFHVNCLASSVKFDDSSCFYCPFCALSLATSEFLESKRKASLAKKELIAFLHSSSDHLLKKPAERLQTKERGYLRQNGDEIHLHKTHQNIDGEMKRESSEQLTTDGPKKPVCRINADGDETSENSQLQTKEHDILGQNGDDTDLRKTPENVDGGTERDASERQTTDYSKKYVCGINIDGEDRPDDEKTIISDYSMRLRRGERQYTYPASPQMRRKKVPWTAKEEQMLKEGVQKFSSDNGRKVSWKEILEYGNFVFMKGRTPVDLKDKWRNMCRGSPKSK